MINVITSICVDMDLYYTESSYPNLSVGLSSEERRTIYWQCASVNILSSLKVHKNVTHFIVTNDTNSITLYGIDIRNKLKSYGVIIVELPFKIFDPSNYSKIFRNAFYKFEVIEFMSKLNDPSILLDADCIWSKYNESLFDILITGKYLLLQDTYQRRNVPDKKNHGISGRDMSILYKTIPICDFHSVNPVWYGGELIGCTPEHYRIISDNLSATIEYCKNQFRFGNELRFSNGTSIFDNDEFIGSYVYNSYTAVSIFDTCNTFSKRLWTRPSSYNVKKEDFNLTIWHLPGEKENGFKEILKDIIFEDSPFWLGGNNSSEYLSKYINIII